MTRDAKIASIEKEVEALLKPVTRQIGLNMKAYFRSGGMSIEDAKQITAELQFDTIAQEIVDKGEEFIPVAKDRLKSFGKKLKISDESYLVLEATSELNLAKVLGTRDNVVKSMVAAGIKYNTENITLEQLTQQLEKYIDDFNRYARVEAMNGVMIFDRTLMHEAYKEAGVEKYFYSGPVGDNRKACEEALSSPLQSTGWTMDDVQNSSVDFATGGGFNCRHQFIPMEEGV